MRDIVDLLLEVNVGAYSVEAGNVRHEHEWKVWRDVRLPEGKVLIPGVVSHKTSAVEHPELVADRLLNYARLVGREHVQAGTDCGMGLGRVHHEVGWAKLQALVDGAGLASRELWGAWRRARPAPRGRDRRERQPAQRGGRHRATVVERDHQRHRPPGRRLPLYSSPARGVGHQRAHAGGVVVAPNSAAGAARGTGCGIDRQRAERACCSARC